MNRYSFGEGFTEFPKETKDDNGEWVKHSDCKAIYESHKKEWFDLSMELEATITAQAKHIERLEKGLTILCEKGLIDKLELDYLLLSRYKEVEAE